MMTRIIRILLPALILLSLAPLAFQSCKSEPVRIDIVQKGDFSALLEAIRSTDKSLSDKIALIEKAVSDGSADTRQAIELIREAIQSLDGSLAQKLAAIETAVKEQSAALETKLALVETAVNGGLADAAQAQALLQQAIQALGGTMDEKLAAIEAALKDQSTALGTKAGLIEAALESGFADYAQAQSLMEAAIESAGETAEEKLAAIQKALAANSSGLEVKLLVIGSTVSRGLVDDDGQMDLIKTALESLGGSAKEKLAAIEAAITSPASGLETKLALILTALESGFSDSATAAASLQQALESSLSDLGTDLSSLLSDITTQLEAIAGQVTFTELEKALEGIIVVIRDDKQSMEDILKSIQEVLGSIKTSMAGGGPISGLVYMGHPTEPVTVSCGKSFDIRLRVNPSTVKLTEDMLQIEQTEQKQFFLAGANRNEAVKNHFPSFTLKEDPDEDGQYIVTIQTLYDELYKYWDETTMVFKCKTDGKDGKDQYASTQPVRVVVMPNPGDGLSISGIEPTATYLMGAKHLGIIYQPLVSNYFYDGSETRTYTAEFLESVSFKSKDSPAIKTLLDRERHFVGFCPDTTLSAVEWKRMADSTYVHDQKVYGSMKLTDRWGGTFEREMEEKPLRWCTCYADTTLIDPHIDPDGCLEINIAGGLTWNYLNRMGLNMGAHPGSTYCSVKFYSASASGAWMDFEFREHSWDLVMRIVTPYNPGASFTLDADITQTVQPSDIDPDYRPRQRKVKYRVRFQVK